MSKYSDLKTSEILNLRYTDNDKIRKEIQALQKFCGSDISLDQHPLVNIGYFLRHIYTFMNYEFSIENFETKYFPLFNDFEHSHHYLDIVNIYNRRSSPPDSAGVKDILDVLDQVNILLSRIGRNIKKNSFEGYITNNDDVDVNVKTGMIGLWQSKPMIDFMWLLHRKSRDKSLHFNGYAFNLLDIMFTTEGYPVEYMNRFLKLNGRSDHSFISDLRNIYPQFSLDSFVKNVSGVFDDIRKKFTKSLDNFFDDDTSEAIDNFTMGLQVLFYIKGYLDYTYKRFGSSHHKRLSLGFSTGVNQDKAKDASKKIKPAVKNIKTPKFKGVFADTTGDGILSKGRGSSQEIANMQITISALIADMLTEKQIDKIVVNDDHRFVEAINKIKRIDTKTVEHGKTFKLDSKLNDGIFGFRTKRLVELFQQVVKEESKIPEDIKKSIEINGVFDDPTRIASEYIINNLFNRQPLITKSEIVSPTIELIKSKPAKDDITDINKILKGDKGLAEFVKLQPKNIQKELVNLYSRVSKGMDDQSKTMIISNIVGYDGSSG